MKLRIWFISIISQFSIFSSQFINYCNEVSQSDESTRSQYEYQHSIFFRHDGQIEDFTGPQKLADSTQQSQGDGETKSIPIPSNMEATALFLAAKASARPSTIQFTTINGMKRPSVAYSPGT